MAQKREREENPDDAYPEFGPFFALLRASGECNMVTDANCVFTSTLCLLALHGKREYVRYLVANIGRFSEIYQKYWTNEDNNRNLYYQQIFPFRSIVPLPWLPHPWPSQSFVQPCIG